MFVPFFNQKFFLFNESKNHACLISFFMQMVNTSLEMDYFYFFMSNLFMIYNDGIGTMYSFNLKSLM